MILDPPPQEAAPRAILRGRLGIARAAWVALVLSTLGVCIGGTLALYERLKTICAGEKCTQWRLSPEGADALQAAGVSPAS